MQRIAGYPIYDPDSKDRLFAEPRQHLPFAHCRRYLADQSSRPDRIGDLVRHRAQGARQCKYCRCRETGAVDARRGTLQDALRTDRHVLPCLSHGHAGQYVRGQKISQGQTNGFPTYRLGTGEMASLNLRITQCMDLMRAEPFPPDSEEMKLLEYYLSARSNGLPIETPAVRY